MLKYIYNYMSGKIKISHALALLFTVFLGFLTLVNWTNRQFDLVLYVSPKIRVAQAGGSGTEWYVSPTGTPTDDGRVPIVHSVPTAYEEPTSSPSLHIFSIYDYLKYFVQITIEFLKEGSESFFNRVVGGINKVF